MSDNFQDNIAYGQSTLAVSGDAIIVGSTDAGAKSVIFNNSGSQGHLAWQPSGNHTINLPDANGTIQLTGQAPGAVYDGANSISTGTIRFTNANGVSFSINGQTISGSVAAQTNQTIGLYALGNTTQNSSTALDARSLSFNALGVISAGFSNGSIQLSVPSATVAFSNANNVVFGTAGATTITASAFFNFSAGTTSNNLSSITFSNSNGVSFGLNGSTITGSVAAQTNQSIGIYAVSNTTQSSSGTVDARSLSFQGAGIASIGYSNGSIVVSVPSAGAVVNFSAGTTSGNLGAIVFSNSNGISFGLNGSTITGSVVPGAATLSLYAIGNTTQNSSTSLNAASLSFNGLGAMTMGYSNGSIQVSAPATSSLSATGAVSISVNGSTISIGAPNQTNQSVGIYAVSNTTNSSFGTVDARSISFQGAGIASVGYTNGSVVISVPSGGGAGDGVNILAAGTQTANTTGTVLFSNSNGVTFGMNNSSVITASVAAGGGTLGFYATGNTTQNSSTTLDARSLSFNALGAATMGYSNGSIQVSVPNGVVSFSNANGVSFGSAGATTITASVAAQTIQTQSLIAGFYDGAASISTGTIFLSNANGVSFGINGQTITASVVGGGGVALSAGTNSTSAGTVVFSNSNNITFGMDVNSIITASFNANNTASTFVLGISTQGNTKGTTGFANQSVQLVGSNGITLSQSINGNSATITILNAVLSAWEPYEFRTGSVITSNAPASFWFNRVMLPNAVAVKNINVLQSNNGVPPTGTSQNSSGTNFVSYSHGITIFTRQDFNGNSTNLSTFGTASIGISAKLTHSSSSQSYQITWVTDSTGGTSSFSTSGTSNSVWTQYVSGLKLWKIPMVTTLSAGEYFFAHAHSSTISSTGQSGLIFAGSHVVITRQISTVGTIGSSNTFVSSGLNGIGDGIASAITTNNTMAASVISANTQQFLYMNFSNA